MESEKLRDEWVEAICSAVSFAKGTIKGMDVMNEPQSFASFKARVVSGGGTRTKQYPTAVLEITVCSDVMAEAWTGWGSQPLERVTEIHSYLFTSVFLLY